MLYQFFSSRPLSRNISITSNASSFDTFSSKNSAILGNISGFYNYSKILGLDRRNTLVAFKDAISESGRKLSLMVSENQQRALESLLSDLQGAKMSPRRKALYSLIFFLLLVLLYWGCLGLIESFLAIRDSLTGHLERMSAAQNIQMSEVTRRLEVLESLVTRIHSQDVDNKLETILSTVKEGAEGNTLVLETKIQIFYIAYLG